jgi:hypothetical protein
VNPKKQSEELILKTPHGNLKYNGLGRYKVSDYFTLEISEMKNINKNKDLKVGMSCA